MSPRKRNQVIIVSAIIVVAVVAAIVVIAMSGQTVATTIDFANLPMSRTEDGAFVLGNADAPVTIVEFSDFACSHCQEYRHTVDLFIREQVATGKAKFEFRLFPTSGGALSEFAGQVAECADEQQPGAFWGAYDQFYQLAESGQYGDQMGRTVTEQLGLDYGQILNCTSTADQTTASVALGRRLGVSGTPAVLIRNGDSEPVFITFGGQTYSAGGTPYEVLKQVVEAQ